jgi:hypothetical protein
VIVEYLAVLLVLGFPAGAIFLFLNRLNSQPVLRDPLPILCRNCGRKSENPVVREKGNTVVEVLLWASNLVLGLVYTFWRSNAPLEGTCPRCGSPDLIPLPPAAPLAHPHL